MKTWVVGAIALAVSVAALGCSDPPKGPPVAAADLCKEWSGAICEAGRSCCSRTVSGDTKGCIEVHKARCAAELLPIVADPRTGYSAARAGEWVAGLRAARDRCSTASDGADGAESSGLIGFVTAFDGTGEVGADCTPTDPTLRQLLLSRLSCGPKNRCRLTLRSNGSLRGDCEALPPDGRRTADDLACSHLHDCRFDEWCDLPDPWRPGLWGECQPPRADGWRCGSAVECRGRQCPGGPDGGMPTCSTPTGDQRYCPPSVEARDGGVGDGGTGDGGAGNPGDGGPG
ncbi:MAG: hypothetical protein EXR72_12505 [Myxococcales bacterium]|nr:hypothetical protein [Myxococcales bacterium]